MGSPQNTPPTGIEQRADMKAHVTPPASSASQQDLSKVSLPSQSRRDITVENNKSHDVAPAMTAPERRTTTESSATSPLSDSEKQPLLRKLYTETASAVGAFTTLGLGLHALDGGWWHYAIPGALNAALLADLIIKRKQILQGDE
jgi:hypothetical protein